MIDKESRLPGSLMSLAYRGVRSGTALAVSDLHGCVPTNHRALVPWCRDSMLLRLFISVLGIEPRPHMLTKQSITILHWFPHFKVLK